MFTIENVKKLENKVCINGNKDLTFAVDDETAELIYKICIGEFKAVKNDSGAFTVPNNVKQVKPKQKTDYNWSDKHIEWTCNEIGGKAYFTTTEYMKARSLAWRYLVFIMGKDHPYKTNLGFRFNTKQEGEKFIVDSNLNVITADQQESMWDNK